jgi:AcrR family transcriptional regulator
MELSKRQKQIIDIATQIIATHGVKGLTIKAIAGELGVTEPALYRHFNSKHDILQTLIACYAEEVDASIATAQVHAAGLDQIMEYFTYREEQYASAPEWARLSFCEEMFYNEEGLADDILILFAKVKTALEDMISQGQEDGSIRCNMPSRVLYQFIFGAHRLLLTEWCYSGADFDYRNETNELRQRIQELLQK